MGGEATAAGDGPLQRRAVQVVRFLGGPAEEYEEYGRLSFISLLRRGLNPDSVVIDAGCGALRAGYWLIHFLDPGCYLGIEPVTNHLDAARASILEPGLEELKRPRFDDNDAFDLSVFGVAPDFVLLRSIWSHTSKRQIEAALDSFSAVASPNALMLGSYIPTRPPPKVERRRTLLGRLLSRPSAPRPRGDKPVGFWRRLEEDYRTDEWSPYVMAHDRDWMIAACRSRGLSAVESPDDLFGVQVWLEIRRAADRGVPSAGPSTDKPGSSPDLS